MILIYWRGKVGSAIAKLCEYQGISYHMRDDTNPVDSYEPYETIIPSPGIPSHHRVYSTGKVMCELDFAYRYLPKGFQTIAVTGTDGKSTTSWIMYSIFQKEYFGKKSVYISGNFDIPFSATILDILERWETKGIIVVEISSFMAYALRLFQSNYSIFTNFKPDHLNWHTDLQDYLDAKMHLMRNTKKKVIMNEQVIVFARENWLALTLPEGARVFSRQHTSRHLLMEEIDSVEMTRLQDRTDGESIVISGGKAYTLSETRFSGIHNAMNILSVALVADEMGISPQNIKKYFSEIEWLPHRLEKIGEKNGIIFVEDSKSTSSQSLEAALGSYGTTKNLLLIVGWSDKGDSFEYLGEKMEKRVKALICMGATKEHFLSLAKAKKITSFATDILDEGVIWLYEKWGKWDVLMLSPGCASFGLFQDYLDRAHQFRASIRRLSD